MIGRGRTLFSPVFVRRGEGGAMRRWGGLLLVLLTALVAFAGWQLRRGEWPQWLDVGAYQLRSRFVEIGLVAVLALHASGVVTGGTWATSTQRRSAADCSTASTTAWQRMPS